MTNTQKEILIDKVIEQIDIDLNMKDYTAIEELLYDISEEKLKGFLCPNHPAIIGLILLICFGFTYINAGEPGPPHKYL